jgi:hypothetical protein
VNNIGASDEIFKFDVSLLHKMKIKTADPK